MNEAVTITLSKPIMAHGKEITELLLRPVTVEDVMELGQPTLLIPGADGNSVGVEIRAKVVGNYLMRLGAVPLSTIKSLSMSDFQKGQNAVMGFFGDGDTEA